MEFQAGVALQYLLWNNSCHGLNWASVISYDLNTDWNEGKGAGFPLSHGVTFSYSTLLANQPQGRVEESANTVTIYALYGIQYNRRDPESTVINSTLSPPVWLSVPYQRLTVKGSPRSISQFSAWMTVKREQHQNRCTRDPFKKMLQNRGLKKCKSIHHKGSSIMGHGQVQKFQWIC